MSEKNNSASENLRTHLFIKNPVLNEIVGIAPILAVAVSIKAGLLLSVMMSCSLLITQALTTALFRRFSQPVRMLMYFLTGSAVSITALAVTDLLLPTLSAELGLFLPLTAVSSFTAVHCERYIFSKDSRSSAANALASCVGYSAVTLIISAIREFASFGTLFGITVFSKGTSKGYLMPFFALLLTGFLSAFFKMAAKRIGTADNENDAFMEHSILTEDEPEQSPIAAAVADKAAGIREKRKAVLEKHAENALKKKEEKLRAAGQKRIEKERLEHERAERERLERERAEQEKLEHERAEKERLERERAEQERLEHERAEKERLEHERAEKERLERERAERERLERERAEKERLERERAEKEKLERERAEKERLERERAERERLERERAERERLERERAERERLELERAERLEREYREAEKRRAEERANAAKAEIAQRREKLRLEEEARAAAAKKKEEELRHSRMSAEEQKMRMREQLENERLVRKALLQEERRRKKLGLPSLTENEINTAFAKGAVDIHHASGGTDRNHSNPFVMPLSDDEED